MATSEITLYSFAQLENAGRGHNAPADVLSAAWAQADEVRETARRDGEAAGYAAGIAQAQAHATPIADALAAAIRGVEATREEMVEALVEQAAELGIAVAEQVLGATLELQPERVAEIVRGALRRVADRQQVTVVVHPDDLELLAVHVTQIQDELGGIDHLEVQGDRRVERGGALARTVHGEIDVTVTAQLRSAREVVAEALRGGNDSAEPDPDQDA